MKEYWTQTELINKWTLSQDELNCIKTKENQLVYALKMRYFDIAGSFPISSTDIPNGTIEFVNDQLRGHTEDLAQYGWNTRTSRLHNDEIRRYHGYKKFSTSSIALLKAHIVNVLFPQGISKRQALSEVYQYLYKNRLEPPAQKQLFKIVHNIYAKHEKAFFKTIAKLFEAADKSRLDALLNKMDDDIILNLLKTGPGRVSTPTIEYELEKLSHIRNTGIFDKIFKKIPRKVLKRYHDKVATSTPSLLLEIKQNNTDKFYGFLICFCLYKGGKILDNLADIFIRRFHKMEERAKAAAKQNLWDEADRQEELLDTLVDVSLTKPDGIIKEEVYPRVGGKAKLEEAKQLREADKLRKLQLEYKNLARLYVYHHRKNIVSILEQFKLRSNLPSKTLEAFQYILSSQGLEPTIFDEVVLAQDKKIITTGSAINKTYYELAVLKKLKKEVRCKNIWVEHALKYANPDKEMPSDFESRRKYYYESLKLDLNADKQIGAVKQRLLDVTKQLNEGMPNNTGVRIGVKQGKPHIFVTPYKAQEEPHNLTVIKHNILKKWGPLSLLEILKEADLRIGLTKEIIDIADKPSIEREILHKRLLLCIYAIATNTEFKRICAGITDVTEQDLWYIKKRYLTPEIMRHVIRKLINSTLAVRDKTLWGCVENIIASDSTKLAVWAENLMSEFHIRLNGDGIMAYWHIEKKALCISSQPRRCSDSEVAAMLIGIINHQTDVEVKSNSTDTHGQSLIAFALSYLIGIELRPRIKGVGRLKIAKADQNLPSQYCSNIKSVMGKVVKWDLIKEHYDEMVKYAVALKNGGDVDAILKRLSADNKQSPLYKGFLELGLAIRSIFLCQYCSSEELRKEIEEALNVIENWHSGSVFVFFGRRGILSSNREVDHELSILCLHLVQSSLVYINTLLMQQIIRETGYKERLTLEDKRAITALFYEHVNQYGTYKLDMSERIPIEM